MTPKETIENITASRDICGIYEKGVKAFAQDVLFRTDGFYLPIDDAANQITRLVYAQIEHQQHDIFRSVLSGKNP